MAKSKLQEVQERLEELQESAKPGWGEQAEVLGLLATVTKSINDAVSSRQEQYTHVVQRLSTIESDVTHIKNDIGSLCKVVRDGNGQPSMIHRLTNLEMIVSNHHDDIAEIRKSANTILAAKALSKSQVIAGVVGMVVTAVISGLALLATLMKD